MPWRGPADESRPRRPPTNMLAPPAMKLRPWDLDRSHERHVIERGRFLSSNGSGASFVCRAANAAPNTWSRGQRVDDIRRPTLAVPCATGIPEEVPAQGLGGPTTSLLGLLARLLPQRCRFPLRVDPGFPLRTDPA
jgi:hypothetical protein